MIYISGLFRDKTMDDKFVYILNNKKLVKTKIDGRKVWTLLVLTNQSVLGSSKIHGKIFLVTIISKVSELQRLLCSHIFLTDK